MTFYRCQFHDRKLKQSFGRFGFFSALFGIICRAGEEFVQLVLLATAATPQNWETISTMLLLQLLIDDRSSTEVVGHWKCSSICTSCYCEPPSRTLSQKGLCVCVENFGIILSAKVFLAVMSKFITLPPLSCCVIWRWKTASLRGLFWMILII